MTDKIARILVLSAMTAELKPLRRALGLQRSPADVAYDFAGTVNGVEVIAAVTRMGLAAAERKTEQILAAVKVDHVMVAGIAGANDLMLSVGALAMPEIVVDERDGIARHPVNLSSLIAAGVLLSTDNLHYDADTVARLNNDNVVMVDMETGAIAAVCERYHCPFSVFRSISDKIGAYAGVYDIFSLAHADGTPRYPAALRYILGNPGRIGYLVRIAMDTKRAITSSTTAVIEGIDRLTAA